jgi:hypothetical protein
MLASAGETPDSKLQKTPELWGEKKYTQRGHMPLAYESKK